jgi:hypothetical protein
MAEAEISITYTGTITNDNMTAKELDEWIEDNIYRVIDVTGKGDLLDEDLMLVEYVEC